MGTGIPSRVLGRKEMRTGSPHVSPLSNERHMEMHCSLLDVKSFSLAK